MSRKKRVIGVRFREKQGRKGVSKTYYYVTDKDFQKGELINVKVPSGGSPEVIVSDEDADRPLKNLKELKVVRDDGRKKQ